MADMDAMKELQDLVARELASQIKSGEAGAAILSVARTFLKDHNVPLRGSADVGALAGVLAEYSEDELPENVRRLNREGN